MLNRGKLYLIFIAGLIIPGLTQIVRGRFWLGFSVPLIGLLWVFIFSYTRWLLSPSGFVIMILGLILIHLLFWVVGIIQKTITDTKWMFYVSLFFLISINALISFTSHTFKKDIFGFEFFYIRSYSMQPTLNPNDIILLDTWFTKKNSFTNGQVVIFKHHKKASHLIKRLKEKRISNSGIQEFFLLGDNPKQSTDSRQFGWIDESKIEGKVSFILYSFTNNENLLNSL